MADQIKTPSAAAPADPVADPLVGTTVGRFAITRRLGAGGMGQVYCAEDTTLKRIVAIKRMAPRTNSSAADHKRLLKEAQRASALNNPNLGAIYDVVEHAGELWLVMEYVEGETLRRRLKQPISLEDFFLIAAQCCEGLQAAQDKGIIHGDIKPENIMLTPGNRVKILDFGVARRTWRAASPDAVTQSMRTMTASGGTPAYMAPEVLLQQPDDGRSDIFSIGLVFYEMLGGDQPFHSDSLATTVAKIVHLEPPPLKNVSASLAAVVKRAIAKNPDARYPNAAALLDDLRRVQQGGKPKRSAAPRVASQDGSFKNRALIALAIFVVMAAALFAFKPLRQLFFSASTLRGASQPAQPAALPQTKIVAVLPFSTPNADTKLAALGEGLLDSIAGKLSKLTEDRSFEVVPPRNLQDRKITTLADAAHYFGANLGLTVSMEPAGDLIKLTYSILNAQTGAPIGGDTITVPASDVFAVEGNVADGTVKALRLQLRPEEQAALNVHGTDQPGAYRYYLQARGYLLDYAKTENIENAILMAREALKLDPNFGMAKAVLGETYWLKYSNTRQKQWTGPAQTSCQEAVKLGNSGAAGHVCLGLIEDGTGHSAEAVSEFQLALGLDPTNEVAATGLAVAYEHEGKITEAEKAYQQAIQAHPNSRFSYNSFGTFYRRRNEYEKALQMFGRVIQIAPEWYGTYVNVAAIYADMGQYEKAIDPLKKSIAIRPSYAGYLNLCTSYFGLNQFTEAAAACEEATKLDPQQYVTWGNLGEAFYYGGKKEQSVSPYRKAVELALGDLKVNPRDPDVLSSLASYYSMLGDRKSALLYLGQALQYGRNDKAILMDAASVYNHLGDGGLAIEWLAKAIQAGYTPDKIRSWHEFDNLANTPGYQQLMKSSHP